MDVVEKLILKTRWIYIQVCKELFECAYVKTNETKQGKTEHVGFEMYALYVPLHHIQSPIHMRVKYVYDTIAYIYCLTQPLGEEIIAFVINNNKCREVLYINLPHSFHTQFRIL